MSIILKEHEGNKQTSISNRNINNVISTSDNQTGKAFQKTTS